MVCEGVTKSSGIAVAWVFKLPISRGPPPELETAIFRIIQEALNQRLPSLGGA